MKYEVINEMLNTLANISSSKEKMAKLKEFSKSENGSELKAMFKFAYDKVDYTYGVSVETIEDPEEAKGFWDKVKNIFKG